MIPKLAFKLIFSTISLGEKEKTATNNQLVFFISITQLSGMPQRKIPF